MYRAIGGGASMALRRSDSRALNLLALWSFARGACAASCLLWREADRLALTRLAARAAVGLIAVRVGLFQGMKPLVESEHDAHQLRELGLGIGVAALEHVEAPRRVELHRAVRRGLSVGSFL